LQGILFSFPETMPFSVADPCQSAISSDCSGPCRAQAEI